MSVTFNIAGYKPSNCTCSPKDHVCEVCNQQTTLCYCFNEGGCKCVAFCDACYSAGVSMANPNARDLLNALGLSGGTDLCGDMKARDLASLIRKTIKAGIESAEIEASVSYGSGGCRIMDGGRDAFYLNSKADRLLSLCDEAGELGVITWG